MPEAEWVEITSLAEFTAVSEQATRQPNAAVIPISLRWANAHHVAEEAFDVLRLHLPDTDLFLRHQSEVACAGGAVAGDPVQASRPLW